MTTDLVDVVPRTAVRFRGHGTHRHPAVHLVHLVRGEAEVVADGRPYHLTQGETLWLAPQVPHSLQAHHDTIAFGPMLGEAAMPPERVVRLGPVPELGQVLLMALSAGPVGEEVLPFRRRIEAILVELQRRPYDLVMPNHHSARRIALRLLAGEPADLAATLPDLARREFTSARQVQRAFLDETGLTFSVWRTRARLNAAVRSLRAGATLAVAADAAGYLTRDGLVRAIVRESGVPAPQVMADPIGAVFAGS